MSEDTRRPRPRFGLAAGPIAAALVGWWCAVGTDLPAPAVATAAVTTLTAIWWVTEPIPVPVTSLLPLALFPVFGVLDHEEVAGAYGHKLILLLMGGFVMSTALERNGAHRRIALVIINLVGARTPRRLVLAFMLTAALLSMWVSNTATSLMLLPVALAVVGDDDRGELSIPLLLGIAYASSIGGMGTPIGTPPNPVFMAVYEEMLADPAYAGLVETYGLRTVSFVGWMAMALPVCALLVPLAWLMLTRNIRSSGAFAPPAVGQWTIAERRVLAVFGIVIVAWVARTVPFGGWSGWFGVPGAWDSTVALVGVVVLFLVPDGAGSALLDWPTARRIPWGLLLLFGGGLAIGKAFGASGLASAIGESLAGIDRLHPYLMVLFVCLAVTFVTELTTNTATASLLMPILGGVALAANVDPKLLMVPATLSASCAFMLPVATAPNAVVYGSERIPLKRMASEGVRLNVAGAVAISAICYLALR